MAIMSGIPQEPSQQSAESFGAQAPIALLGLAAIAIIALINANARPAADVPPQATTLACSDGGTVVAVRQSAHSSPVVQQLAAGFKVGDVVQVNGNALSLRPQAS